MAKPEYRARIILHDADKLTKKEVKQLQKWLQRSAETLSDEHGNFGKTLKFTYIQTT